MNHVYSVGQITKYIKNLFGQDFLLNQVSVRGEISGMKDHPSGHLYFTLKDGASVLPTVMFQSQRLRGLKSVPREGMRVIVTGSIDIYESSGRYQLYAKEINEDGEGEAYRRFLLLKQKLEEMGMFDPAYKKPIPRYAKTVGIVTASSGAAFQDIIRVAKERNPKVQLILSPATVQGENAPASIVSAIKALDRIRPDVMIVGRGGGSFEDLNCFNDEAVARAIFDCETPVISAVGHEVDFTIADFTADYRAATPSQAAEIAVFDLEMFQRTLRQYATAQKNRLYALTERYRKDLKVREAELNAVHPKTRIRNELQRVGEIHTELIRSIRDRIRAYQEKISVLSAKLNALSPLLKLKGGYGYIESDGVPVQSVHEVSKGDPISVILFDGTIEGEVKRVKGRKS